MHKLPVALLAVLSAAVVVSAPAHSLVKKWETAPDLKVTESALYDGGRGLLFVSNIDGAPWDDDGKGEIAKVGLDGHIIKQDWITGLSAPKGLGVHGSRLYAADIDRVVVIDIEQGVIVEKIAVPGSHGLNDISVDAQGVVYVSDSKDKKIWSIDGHKVALVIENLDGPNGVYALGRELYFLDNGSLFKLGPKGDKVLVSAGEKGNGDGLESIGGGEFVMTYWNGLVQYVKADGTREQLLDTRAEKISSADLGYDKEHHIVFVPTFAHNTVVAYELK